MRVLACCDTRTHSLSKRARSDDRLQSADKNGTAPSWWPDAGVRRRDSLICCSLLFNIALLAHRLRPPALLFSSPCFFFLPLFIAGRKEGGGGGGGRAQLHLYEV